MTTRQGFGIRPRTLGELVDLPFRVYRARIGLFAAIGIGIAVLRQAAAIGYQAFVFGSVGADMAEVDPMAMMNRVFLGIPTLLLITSVTYTVGALPIVAASRDTVVGVRRPARAILRDAWRRLPAGIVTAILIWVLAVFGFVMCIAPGIIVSIGFALALPVVYLERRGPLSAMGRSWEMVFLRGPGRPGSAANWVRVVLLGVVTIVVLFALDLLATLPVSLVQALSMMQRSEPIMTAIGPQWLPLQYMLPLYLAGALLQGVFLAIAITPWPVLYLDIRARNEGWDLEQAVDRLARSEP